MKYHHCDPYRASILLGTIKNDTKLLNVKLVYMGNLRTRQKAGTAPLDIRNKVKFCSGPGLICAVIHAGGDLIEVPGAWIQNFPVTSKFRMDDIHSSQTSRLLGP